jgi:hypothetical protein
LDGSVTRVEESSTIEERRLGWNEEGGKQGCVYIRGSSYSKGQNLISIGFVRGNMQMDLKYT